MTDNIKQKEKIKTKKTEKTRSDSILDAVKTAAKIADEKKADYVKILDMRSRLIITDYFIIISAKNTRLTRRIEEDICFDLKKKKLYPKNITGANEGNWILIDYDDFVIHVFTEQFRQFYDLERLWKDSEEIKWGQ
ncbi:ribosome silencing factor [Actinomycetota bacterium]